MHILVDDVPVPAVAGQSVAVAMMAAGILALRASPVDAAPRGAFCLMGICQDCVVRIDGVAAPACQVPVRDGLAVTLGRTGA